MPAPDTLAQFFLASIMLGLAPGPDNIYVLTQSAVQGRRAGMVVTLGLCTGLILHTALVTLGVATLIATSAPLFMFLKLGGRDTYSIWRIRLSEQMGQPSGCVAVVLLRTLIYTGAVY